MSKQFISEEEIIQMTLENVRSFYSREKDFTTAQMADNFMWIGSNDFQWCEGLDEFYSVTKNEYDEPPVLLSDEEYHLLIHERNIWVVYGRYKATVILKDGTVLHAHVRGTYVWHRVKEEMQLVHVHGSHAQDIPLNQVTPPEEQFTADSSFFDYMKRMDALTSRTDKLTFREHDGKHRFFFSDEILFLKAAGQNTMVYTKTESFLATGLLTTQEENLPPHFKRIHKSYVINTLYIDSIYRYRAILKDGQEIPIGKDKYMELKAFLKKTN